MKARLAIVVHLTMMFSESTSTGPPMKTLTKSEKIIHINFSFSYMALFSIFKKQSKSKNLDHAKENGQ